MNRRDLVDYVIKKEGMTKKQADQVLGTIMAGIQAGVKKDGEVRLVGFGTFKKSVRKARKARNPQTGEAIKVAKKTVAKFVTSKAWNPLKPNIVTAKTVKKTTKKTTKR